MVRGCETHQEKLCNFGDFVFLRIRPRLCVLQIKLLRCSAHLVKNLIIFFLLVHFRSNHQNQLLISGLCHRHPHLSLVLSQQSQAA